jgi:hypothetical protein
MRLIAIELLLGDLRRIHVNFILLLRHRVAEYCRSSPLDRFDMLFNIVLVVKPA